MRRGLIPLLAVVAVSTASCGGSSSAGSRAEREETPGPAVTVELREEASSGESGTATLEPLDEMSTAVVVKLAPAKQHSHYFAHIHIGTCADYRKLETLRQQEESVVDELQDLSGGRSESTLYTTPLAERTTGGYSINVHAPIDAYRVVACGDIPSR